jgi:hypothetical protein
MMAEAFHRVRGWQTDPMDEPITVRKTSENDGLNSRWALIVGSEPVVAIRTADSVPKAKAVEYLFRALTTNP